MLGTHQSFTGALDVAGASHPMFADGCLACLVSQVHGRGTRLHIFEVVAAFWGNASSFERQVASILRLHVTASVSHVQLAVSWSDSSAPASHDQEISVLTLGLIFVGGAALPFIEARLQLFVSWQMSILNISNFRFVRFRV